MEEQAKFDDMCVLSTEFPGECNPIQSVPCMHMQDLAHLGLCHFNQSISDR